MMMIALLVALIASLLPLTESANVPTLTWPKGYSASGNIILPYAEINEDFVAYVDLTNNRSRIDSYSGSASVINRGDQGDNGIMYKIVPVTTNFTYNTRTCFAVPGGKDQPVQPQTVLPDPSTYKYVGNGKGVDNSDTMIFTSQFTEGNKDNIYTLIVNAKDMSPVSLYFLGYDRIFGSHYDEYTITYSSFTSTTPDPSVFEVEPQLKCTGFPGPGNSTPMSESLFFEVFGAESYTKESKTHHIDVAFNKFKSRYGKRYSNEKEEAKRRNNFHHNFRFVKSKNMMKSTYSVAINHLADLDQSEMKKMRGHINTGITSKYIYSPTVQDMPPYINWRLRGAVTPVKDQGICGSCWSFGTTGTLEGSLFVKTGKLVSLSEQAFVDCSWGQGNNGCDGGESERAYEWLLLNGKCLPTEFSYPYKMEDSECHDDKATCGVKIDKYYNVMSGNVTDLKLAIFEKGPISIGIDASHRSFSFYSNGVYYEKLCGNTPDDLDHQVLAVGYGVLNNQEYVIVKNSWSTHWGTDGYVLMSTLDNNCGIATDASYADVLVPN